jgi:hypothetical protein
MILWTFGHSMDKSEQNGHSWTSVDLRGQSWTLWAYGLFVDKMDIFVDVRISSNNDDDASETGRDYRLGR